MAGKCTYIHLGYTGGKSFFKNGELAASIYGCNYQERSVTVNQAARYRKMTGAPYHIGMLHGMLSGAEGHDPYCPFTKEDLEKAAWITGRSDTFINGRFCPPSIPPPFTLNIQARHLKETGPKGYYLVRAANGEMSWEFKEAHDVLWEEIDLDISGAEHMTSLLKAASDTFSGLRAAGRPACVRLVLRGAPRF